MLSVYAAFFDGLLLLRTINFQELWEIHEP